MRMAPFTGAKKGGKLGKVQAADKGTLLLDEINELPWRSKQNYCG